jgi:hypothetical protein
MRPIHRAVSAWKAAAACIGRAPTRPSQPIGPALGEPDSLLRRWYFAANYRGLNRNFGLVKAAVASARANTTLEAFCIYHGEDCEALDWVISRGVHVIRRESSLSRELKSAYGEKYPIFSGHWLRVDIPNIDLESEYVLYTDVDVMFLQDPRRYMFRPTLAAAAEESHLGVRRTFNSGVLVLNMPAMRLVHEEFLSAIRRRLANGFSFPPHDQGSFNEFFRGRIDWMSPEFNWKAYWGANRDAVIVHFHGPKPMDAAKIKTGREGIVRSQVLNLYRRDPAGYEEHLRTFRRFVKDSNRQI